VVDRTEAEVNARAVAASSEVDAAVLRTQDQRRISGIWERTQQVIAITVVETAVFVAAILTLVPSVKTLIGAEAPEAAVTAGIAGMLFLTAVANLVIGFYFGRTNHSRTGGVGSRDSESR